MPRKQFKRAPRKSIAQEAYEDNNYVPPVKEHVGGGSETLQAKAYRDLANIGVIDVKADPNAELSYGAFPYTIIGRTNPVLDAKYPGYTNIAGNSITEIQNNTTTSLLMNVFDAGVICKKINYLYLPITNGVNLAYAAEMIKAIEQAVSFGWSTMLTDLQFTKNEYRTDMPLPASAITNSGQTGVNRTLTKSAGYYACTTHYQCVLQSLVQPISKYIELRSLEKEMMRMSFRTEAPLLTQLFGLFKKSSFIAEINTIGTVVINEYFDANWYKQMNTLQCVPSRKTKGMTDPLLTLVGVHSIPRLQIKVGETTNYDSDSLKTGATAVLLDPEDYIFKQGAVKLEDLILKVLKLMNPTYILRFIRLMNHGEVVAEPGAGETACLTISAYGEAVKNYLSYIARFASIFSTQMSDVRTFLDKLSASNMVYWKKGVAFFVDKIEQLEPHYNALLNDVFAATYAGADKVIFDNNTKRWRAWAFWNKYTGIPEFDRVSGGSFLTFGLRDIQSTDSAGNAVDFEASAGLMPILFKSDFNQSLITTRLGGYDTINKVSLTNAGLSANHSLSRLNVMSNPTVSVKVPAIDITIDDATLQSHWASAALQFLGNVFGYGFTQLVTEVEDEDVTTYPDQLLDPDYVAFIDLEIEDVSNQMIVFARNYAPFRVDTPDGKRTMGFSA